MGDPVEMRSKKNSVKSNSSKRQSTRGQKEAPVTSANAKCVVLGDGDVGKSAFLLTFLSGRFPEECPPGPMDMHTEYDHLTNRPTTLKHENVEVHLTLLDTYGQDEYEKLREKLCVLSDVYILCFDVTKRETYERIRHHWVPEMKRYSSPDTPYILVGLKTDIRSKALANPKCDMSTYVTFDEGRKMSEEIGALHYTECSAFHNSGVKRAMEMASHAALRNASTDLNRASCVVS